MRQNELLGDGPVTTSYKARSLREKWYVVLTKFRSEESAAFHLKGRRITVFYPKLFLPLSNNSARQVVALFPNYLFVRIDALSAAYSRVVWCPGVKRLVSFDGTPSAVDDCIVDFMRDQTDAHDVIVARSNLKVGDEVQIAKGAFKGLIGIIQEPPDTRSRVRVLMSILSRPVQVEVPAGYIDIGWIAPSLGNLGGVGSGIGRAG
jgi:transcription elongation factor/antiterminator RfaH